MDWTALHCTELNLNVLYCIVLHCTTCTALHYIALNSNALHSNHIARRYLILGHDWVNDPPPTASWTSHPAVCGFHQKPPTASYSLLQPLSDFYRLLQPLTASCIILKPLIVSCSLLQPDRTLIVGQVFFCPLWVGGGGTVLSRPTRANMDNT